MFLSFDHKPTSGNQSILTRSSISSPACLSEKFHCWLQPAGKALSLSQVQIEQVPQNKIELDSISFKAERKTSAVGVKSGPRIADINTHVQCQSLAPIMRNIKSNLIERLTKYRKEVKPALAKIISLFRKPKESPGTPNPFAAQKMELKPAQLMGVYFSQANSKARYARSWQQTRERSNRKFSQNRPST